MGSGIMEGMLREYENILPHFSIFKKSVLDRPKTFINNIRSTFVSRRYQFKIDAPTYINEGYALIAALRILTSFPLASVQISVGKGGVLRFMRRGGRLTKRLVELGLTDDFGGKIYHSLRVTGDDLSPTNYFGIHGDVLVYMQKPFTFITLRSFPNMLKTCWLRTRAILRFQRIRSCGTACAEEAKDVSCTDVVGVIKLHQWTFYGNIWSEMNSQLSEFEKENKRICVDICSLSKLYTWQSTGIFRVFFKKA